MAVVNKIIILLVFISFFSGCISFIIPIPDDPEAMVEYTAISLQLPKDGNYEKEISSDIIQTSEPLIYAIIKVVNVSQTLQLKWQWYNPDKKLVKTSKPREVNSGGKYLEYFAAWDNLQHEYFAANPGKWQVVISCNDRFFYKFDFQIREVKTQSQSNSGE